MPKEPPRKKEEANFLCKRTGELGVTVYTPEQHISFFLCHSLTVMIVEFSEMVLASGLLVFTYTKALMAAKILALSVSATAETTSTAVLDLFFEIKIQLGKPR